MEANEPSSSPESSQTGKGRLSRRSGAPSLAMPAGIGPSGLPIGLQVIGRNHDDAGVIEFAAAWERETRFVEKHLPPLIAP